MSKSKVPFKSTPMKPWVKGELGKTGPEVHTKRKRGGLWIGRNKSKRIKAVKVNEKQERFDKYKWTIKWAIAIPLGIYALWWLYALIADMFLFS